MDIEKNILNLCNQMQVKGWKYISQDEEFIILENDLIFTEQVRISFPMNKNLTSYPFLLQSGLVNLLRIDNQYRFSSIVGVLMSQAKNIRHRYSKDKKQWILSEPDSKYNLVEIPDIYIPKLDIFE